MHKQIALALLGTLIVAIMDFAVAADDDWLWNVSETPPALEKPKIFDISKLEPQHTAGWRRYLRPPKLHNPLLCHGLYYRVKLDEGEDGIVHMSGTEPLQYPLHVTGGRNVRIVGLHFDLVTQPGCGVGELPNLPVDEHPNANIHPRIPWAMAIRVEQSNVTFMEGLHIDVRGHEADCIVVRNPDPMDDAEAQTRRDIIIQNSYCSGVEGLGKSPIGDGIHGDLFQNQGQDIMRRLVFENVTMRTSQEGIVLHGSGAGKSSGTKELVIRRYDYSWDPRYVGDDDYEMFGLAFDGWPDENWTLEDIRIKDYRDLDYLIVRGQRYGNSTSGRVKPHEAIRSGLPEGGAFAPPDRTGLNYVTPHDAIPGL